MWKEEARAAEWMGTPDLLRCRETLVTYSGSLEEGWAWSDAVNMANHQQVLSREFHDQIHIIDRLRLQGEEREGHLESAEVLESHPENW